MTFIRHAEEIPSQPKVQRQALVQFPIVLEIECRFIVMEVPNAPREGFVILESAQFVRVLHETKLRYACHGSGEKIEQLTHGEVVAARSRSAEPGHVRRADRGCGNRCA